MKKKHNVIERTLAKIIHDCRNTVKMEELESETTTVELADIGEFNTVDSLYMALWEIPEADFSFERNLNRAKSGDSILHKGVKFTVIKIDDNGAKTVAIETLTGGEYVCRLNNVCVNKLLISY